MKTLRTLLGLVVMLALTSLAAAQTTAPIASACLITNQGSINDGSINEDAYVGMQAAADTHNLETTFVETQAPTDFEGSIAACVSEGYDVVITIGFGMADATRAAADANPGTLFIGVDQFVQDGPPNYAGVQFREEQVAYAVGVLAGLVTESDVVGGVFGDAVPPILRFRNGYVLGVQASNPDAEVLTVYIDNFDAPERGAAAAQQMIGEGVDVLFGAGGLTGSGATRYTAEQGVYVIGVDQDEFVTLFGGGTTPGAEFIITSALKRVDVAIEALLDALATGDPAGFPAGGNYVGDAANGGLGLAPAHLAEGVIPQEAYDAALAALDALGDGSLTLPIDPQSGVLLDEAPAPAATGTPITSVCLVTNAGSVTDGSFNQSAYEGMVNAADAFDLETAVVESASPADFTTNIDTCVSEGYDVVLTVGFPVADATLAAAQTYPDVFFIGVDQFVFNGPTNYAGVQFREDQMGYAVGVLAGLLTESNLVGGVFGDEIPPVVKFRNGFVLGVQASNPDAEVLTVYIDSFIAPDRGAAAAQQMIGNGVDVLFGGGGVTGTGAIRFAAEQGVAVIGVDQDEFVTSFGSGASPGAEFIITSALKRVDVAVETLLAALATGDLSAFPGGTNYIGDASNSGVGLAPTNLADVPEDAYAAALAAFNAFADGTLTLPIDPVTGAFTEDVSDPATTITEDAPSS